MMRWYILCFIVFALVCSSLGQQSTGTTKIYNPNGTLAVDQISTQTLNVSTFSWLKPGVNYWFSFGGEFTLPAPDPVPQMPPGAPAYVTNCPQLGFYDAFNEANFAGTLSKWGPISAPVKWIYEKPDARTWWSVDAGAWAYDTSAGYLQLHAHNYYQSLTQKGTGAWFGVGLSTLAYTNGGAINGQSTGFKASPPFYWEAAIWVPQLVPGIDVPNAAGLWPSFSLYTDPAVTAANGSSVELDVFELYSVDYTVPHCSWHNWSSTGHQIAALGTTFTHGAFPDLSAGWHIWGIWVDVQTTHWYLDGKEIFTQPTQSQVPYYAMLANALGGGWQVSLTPSQVYTFKVGYIMCWTK